METRLTAEDLLSTLSAWDLLISGKGKIHLIACGGTALTLLGYKPSTKDVDFLVPVEKEYKKLVTFLKDAGYKQVTGHGWQREDEKIRYDLFCGNIVFMTELLDSPLKAGGHKVFREFNNLYLGILNSLDLIITKLARGTDVDIQDCLSILRNEEVDLEKLKERYEEAAQYAINYGVNEKQAMKHFDLLMKRYKNT